MTRPGLRSCLEQEGTTPFRSTGSCPWVSRFCLGHEFCERRTHRAEILQINLEMLGTREKSGAQRDIKQRPCHKLGVKEGKLIQSSKQYSFDIYGMPAVCQAFCWALGMEQ